MFKHNSIQYGEEVFFLGDKMIGIFMGSLGTEKLMILSNSGKSCFVILKNVYEFFEKTGELLCKT